MLFGLFHEYLHETENNRLFAKEPRASRGLVKNEEEKRRDREDQI